ncbi:MAG TPA: FecR domain-containing protein [Herbaspirillum sp.]|jgi:transmembrane sensor
MSRHSPIEDLVQPRARTPEEIEKQAWVWLRLLDSGAPTQWDLDSFRHWARANQAHRAAFNRARRELEAMRPAVGALYQDGKNGLSRAGASAATVPGHRRSRRVFLGTAIGAAAAAVAGVAVYPPLGLWPAAAEWNADYRTATGEQRTLALAERVSVTLNTRTSIRRQVAAGRTVGLDLITGEAAVDVTQAGSSFTVVAGAGRSIAGSGQFEVRYLGNRVCVTCLAGTVRVEHPAAVRLLQARQQTVYDNNAIGGIADVEPAEVSAWRNGELLFNNTRLSDVIEEINRYRPGRVVLANDALRDKKVNGRFAIASLDLALGQLRQVFNLKSSLLVGGVLILS